MNRKNLLELTSLACDGAMWELRYWACDCVTGYTEVYRQAQFCQLNAEAQILTLSLPALCSRYSY